METLIIAFSMYSRIPMPDIDWNPRNMRYVFCWFPFIGLVIGAFELAAYLFFVSFLHVSTPLAGAVLTAIPLAVTGGIHLDGYMDTRDALSSYADRQKMLDIMKDPHIGAFAVIGGGMYLLLQFGAWCEVCTAGGRMVLIMAFTFALERALSGLMAVYLPGARPGGMLSMIKEPAQIMNTKRILLAEIAGLALLMLITWWKGARVVLIAALIVTLHYRHLALTRLGGTTGDLAGWFLQKCELWCLLVLAVAAHLF